MIKLEKNVWIYIVILLIVTYAFQIFAIYNGGEEYQFFDLVIGISMFFPAIGAIWYLVKTKTGLGYIDWKIRKPLYLILSLLIPIAITLLGILLIEKLGIATNHAYSVKGSVVDDIEIPLLLGTEVQSLPFFVLNFLVTGIVFSLITGLLTIGEEIGWRGFLQKKLLETNSTFKSLTFLGVLWGFWHFPLIINGFNYPEYPVLGAFLIFPVTTVFISFFMGMTTINSKSVWPAVLTHGAINSIMIFLFEMDFGAHKLYGNFAILAIWMVVGILAYLRISPKK